MPELGNVPLQNDFKCKFTEFNFTLSLKKGGYAILRDTLFYKALFY